jgi:hypothetical protein
LGFTTHTSQREILMITMPTLCIACTHKHPHNGGDPHERITCDAYPDGIPWQFWEGGSSHLDPAADGSDGGLVFTADGRDPEFSQGVIETFVAFWDVPNEEIDD